jgi:hypothetical protein
VGEGGARSAPGEGSVFAQLELRKQVFHDGISPLQDVVVPVPYDFKSFAGQDSIAPFIPLGISVLAPVNFNDQPTLKANEIQDVALKWNLPAKFEL